jgi:hypothetical protein
MPTVAWRDAPACARPERLMHSFYFKQPMFKNNFLQILNGNFKKC